MKKLITLIVALGILLSVTSTAYARDTRYLMPIASALNTKDAQEKLDKSIKIYFGNQAYPRVLANFGTETTNRKTNSFGKSDQTACNWGFLSALLTLQKRAHQLGANAVVNVVSYYKKNEISSTTDFECHAGGVVAGVALKGDFVKIAA